MLSVCNFDDYKLDIEFVYPAPEERQFEIDNNFKIVGALPTPDFYFTDQFKI